jgi:hypothetical protein
VGLRTSVSGRGGLAQRLERGELDAGAGLGVEPGGGQARAEAGGVALAGAGVLDLVAQGVVGALDLGEGEDVVHVAALVGGEGSLGGESGAEEGVHGREGFGGGGSHFGGLCRVAASIGRALLASWPALSARPLDLPRGMRASWRYPRCASSSVLPPRITPGPFHIPGSTESRTDTNSH